MLVNCKGFVSRDLGSACLFEKSSALWDLGSHVVVKESLGKDEQSAVLALDTELHSLDVDLNIVNLSWGALLLGLRLDPSTKLVIRGVATLLILITNDKLLLEISRELLLASFDSLLRHVNGPLVVADLADGLREVLLKGSWRLGAVIRVLILLSLLRVVVLWSSLLSLPILLRLTGGLAIRLILLSLLWGLLQDEARELEAKVNVGTLTTGLAVKNNVSILDVDHGLWVLAGLAKDELGDEAIEVVLQLGGLVSTVDDPAVVGWVAVGLGTELEAEVLDDIGSWAGQRVRDGGQVDDNGLDSVALALNLRLNLLHLVAVEGVGDIAANVNGGHDCG